jgi:hypothetical protein
MLDAASRIRAADGKIAALGRVNGGRPARAAAATGVSDGEAEQGGQNEYGPNRPQATTAASTSRSTWGM